MKENKQPILSICIPTWNRWYSLQYTLKSIMDQDEFKFGVVEIVISDNASTDDTEFEVRKLCKKYEHIRYYRNKENIGSNPNINKVLSLGEGEYLWLLGSDDSILKGGLKNTLDTIHLYNPDLLLHKNREVPKFKLLEKNNQYMLSFNSQKEYFEYLGKQYIYDKHSFLHIENLQTFMSLICIKKEYYLKMLTCISSDKHRKNIYNKFYFSQNIISHFDETKNKIICINIPYITNLDNTTTNKKTGYVTSLGIVKDSLKLNMYIYKKYKLNYNYILLSFKSFLFRFGQFILGKLKMGFNGKYSKKFFSYVGKIIYK